MTHLARLAFVLLALTPAAAAAQSAADSAAVTAFYGRWFGSARQGAESYASFYAADGVILPPNAPPAAGGEGMPFETKYVDLLHRIPGGWEVTYRMWSDNKP